MVDLSFDLRQRLVERIHHVSSDHLPYIEQAINDIESRGSTLVIPANASISPLQPRDWPHAPLHRISEQGTYIVTAGTLHKQHWFQTAERLDLLESALLQLANKYRWQLEAWAVFSNHYHFVGHCSTDSADLKTFLCHLHTLTATEINRMDSAPERQIWHNYWDTRLTFKKSYFARLNYVHQNAVKHGLARVANQYRWCSAAWFERTATPAQVKTIYSFKTDRVRVCDDFDVLLL